MFSLSASFKRKSIKPLAVVVWLLFSVALAIWWLIFGLKQIDRISQIGGAAPIGIANEIAREHRMLLSEGSTLILLLLLGGSALLYYIATEIRRSRRLQEFFAAFTHDLKTSLASLRLQAESLEDDLRETDHAKLMRRLVKDTVRLELQLENSLLLASPSDSARFLLENVRLADLFKSMRHQWPELDIEISGDAIVVGDQRAIESIFKNIFQNAVVHGRAQRVEVHVDATGAWVTIQFVDDGRGFKGDRARLGKMFERHSTSSGSGLGLYLASKLANSMKGEVRFNDSPAGFSIDVVLPQGTRLETA
jgi:signal transduction histidine kinase